MKTQVLRGALSAMVVTGAMVGASQVLADPAQETYTSAATVKQVVAQSFSYAAPASSGYKWGAEPVDNQVDERWASNDVSGTTGYKWSSESVDDSAPTQSHANRASFAWSTKSAVKQAGYRWGK